jgi:capsule polysaccharide export protein KpsE/RkpR
MKNTNKMKYNNVIIDLKPRPVLQELIKDLTNKMLAQKLVLDDCYQYMDEDSPFIQGLKSDIRLLDQVIERCYAQQDLIDSRDEQLIGLN